MKYLISLLALGFIGCGDSGPSTPVTGTADSAPYIYTAGAQDRLICSIESLAFASSDKSQCLLVFTSSDCDTRYTHQTTAALANFDADILRAKSYYDACLSGAAASVPVCTESYKYQLADALRSCGQVQL